MSSGTTKFDGQRAAGMLIIIVAIYIALQHCGILNFLIPSTLAYVDMSYGLLFAIGLLASVHCIAVCGGISLSQCMPQCFSKGRCCVDSIGGRRQCGARAEESGVAAAGDICWGGSTYSAVIRPSILYNIGRVVSYTLIGAAAGALGSAITFSVTAHGFLKLAAGVIMLAIGISILRIFPWTRKAATKMPRVIEDRAGIYKGRGPLIIGLLNGFLPCAPLYVVQLFALSTGSPLKGAVSMLMFSLGTVPLVFGLGTFSSAIGRRSARKVVTAGAVMISVLGLCMLSQSWNLFGIAVPSFAAVRHNDGAVLDIAIDRGPQIINSTLTPHSYPSIKVESGRTVRWIINAPEGSINGCNSRLIIRQYGIEYELRTGDNVIVFTPEKRGRVRFSCRMGIMSGTITVVGPGEITEGLLEKRQRPPKEGEPCC